MSALEDAKQAVVSAEPVATPSIGQLVMRLVEDIQHLFRTEIRLAKSELKGNIASIARGGVFAVIGGVVLLGALFTLLGAAVAFLAPLVGVAFAALIVAMVAGIVGGLMVRSGIKKISVASLAPDRAVASLKQDADALKGSL